MRATAFSSELISLAVAHTRSVWEPPPSLGIITFVDASKVRRKRDPGRCYLRAGWKPVGKTVGGLLAFQQLPKDMPSPLEIPCDQLSLVTAQAAAAAVLSR